MVRMRSVDVVVLTDATVVSELDPSGRLPFGVSQGDFSLVTQGMMNAGAPLHDLLTISEWTCCCPPKMTLVVLGGWKKVVESVLLLLLSFKGRYRPLQRVVLWVCLCLFVRVCPMACV